MCVVASGWMDDVIAIFVVSILAAVLIFLRYRALLFTTFDPEVADVAGGLLDEVGEEPAHGELRRRAPGLVCGLAAVPGIGLLSPVIFLWMPPQRRSAEEEETYQAENAPPVEAPSFIVPGMPAPAPELEAHLDRKPSTLCDYRSVIRAHLLPAFGALRLEDVTGDRIEAWKGTLRMSNRTKVKLPTVLNGVFVRARRATSSGTTRSPTSRSLGSGAPWRSRSSRRKT